MNVTPNSRDHAFYELLQSLQLTLHAAYQTQVTVNWGETDTVAPFNKLYFITEGAGWIRIDGEDYRPKPGQMLLVPANSRHSFSPIEGRKPFLKNWCHFNVMVGPFDLFQWIHVPLCIDIEDVEGMNRKFTEMIGHFHSKDSFFARLREKQMLLDIVAAFLDLVPISVMQHRSEEMNRLGIIQRFVESRLDCGISVEQMAEAVHLHPNYFISYFKKHFGMPPLKYVNRKRADHAKQLLTTTSLSIKEIADRTGFKETGHFTKFFRKETSFTPTDYRAAFTYTQ
ncbi:AraC family transcriptional regulator [Paenibacillus sp. NEAU-GSW1]|uniref:helix-turn-helix domain-containing protein n=1 Tax=Paenibacillus sp. NEAU-GSW1 TaxID=2682486 RepID=UPI0015636888|nr:AraC family transcriptional regulator [Paenibacillus sp. NEAU-GSW1]